MSKSFIYRGAPPFRNYLINFFDDPVEVSEEEFFHIVGYDRDLVPMKYAGTGTGRQNFYMDGDLIGFRER